ncbi:MAG: MFS transporter, partial [Chloroflexota bacterium]|nr:MFS transporter [Chloroflexota bacterium]
MRSASAPPTATLAPPALPPLPWSAVALCFMAMFFVMGARTGFAVLYPRIVADMGWTVAEVTGAFSAGLFVYAPMAVVAGVVLDRFGCRFSMLVGSACLTAGMVTAASATELWHLYVAFILTNGIGSPGVGFITVIKVLSLRAGPRFATAFGIAFMGQGAGALVVSPAVQGVVDAAGW